VLNKKNSKIIEEKITKLTNKIFLIFFIFIRINVKNKFIQKIKNEVLSPLKKIIEPYRIKNM
jgi:hypothetical protein